MQVSQGELDQPIIPNPNWRDRKPKNKKWTEHEARCALAHERPDMVLVTWGGKLTAKSLWLCECGAEYSAAGKALLYRGGSCKRCGLNKAANTRRLTPAELLKRFREVHGDRYHYIESTVTGRDDLVTIICPKHGEFQQIAANHANGNGCKGCRTDAASKARRHTPDQWLARFRATHGDRYEYDKSTVTTAHNKMTITCPDHGPFEQTPGGHASGKGCPTCGGSVALDANKLLSQFSRVHGDRYSYPDMEGATRKSMIAITCPDHGPFEQMAGNHASGSGCLKCAYERVSDAQSYNHRDYLQQLELKGVEARALAEYKDSKTPLLHRRGCGGEWMVTPNKVLSRDQHCPACVDGASDADAIYIWRERQSVTPDMPHDAVKIGITSWRLGDSRPKNCSAPQHIPRHLPPPDFPNAAGPSARHRNKVAWPVRREALAAPSHCGWRHRVSAFAPR